MSLTDYTSLQREAHAAHLARQARMAPAQQVAAPVQAAPQPHRLQVEANAAIAAVVRGPPVDAIIAAVARFYGIAPAATLLGQSRLAKIVTPRHVAIYLARELKGMSWPKIGCCFHRDHSTAIVAWRSIAAQIEFDPDLRAAVASIRKQLEERAP
jgi:chromosomal replication initiation ATPase DnaA